MVNESGNSVELLPAQAEFLLVDDDVTMDVALYQGGYGCVAGDTLIELADGSTCRIDEFQGGHVVAWSGHAFIPAYATKPAVYDKKPLYRVTTTQGRQITCTAEHRFLTRNGWKRLHELEPASWVYTSSPIPRVSSWVDGQLVHALGADDSLQTVPSFQSHYSTYPHRCDARPLEQSADGQGVETSRNDAHECNHVCLSLDGQASLTNDNHPCRLLRRHSSCHCVYPLDHHVSSTECCADENTSEQPFETCPQSAQSLSMTCLERPSHESAQPYPNLSHISYTEPPNLLPLNYIRHEDQIQAIESVGEGFYYDLHVPIYNNYVAHGFINHNSGKTWSGSLLGLLLAQQMPGSLGLVVAKTFPMVRDTTMRTYFEHLDKLVEDGILELGDYSWNKSEARLTFHCFNDSEIIFRHLEDPEKVKSLNLAWVQVEEASMITEADFLMLLSRLRQKYPVLRWFGHTNPQPTKGWIYKYFVQNNQGKRKDGKAVINYRRIMAPSTQNKFLPAGYLENMAGAFDPEYYAINVLGQDGDYTAGLVVKNWSIANEDTSIKYNPNWPIYITCDFNVDPMCWALVHRTGQGEYLVFDEICEPGTTIETIERFHQRYPNHQAGIIITGDASGDNRSTQAAQSNHTNYIQMRNYLSSVGYRSVAMDVPTKNPGVDDRIKAFNAAVCDTLFRRKFKINPDKCKWIKYNMENCKYIEGSSVIWEPTANDIKRDTTNTIKFTKHPLDAVSYIVAKYDPIKLDETLHNKPRLKAVANRPRVY